MSNAVWVALSCGLAAMLRVVIEELLDRRARSKSRPDTSPGS